MTARPLVSGSGSILGISAAACSLLWLMFPDDLSSTFNLSKPGYLSNAYLTAMLSVSPDDEEIRLNLVQNLLAQGQLGDAENVLEPLLGSNNAAKRLLREILYRDYFSNPDEQVRQQLLKSLSALSATQISERDKQIALQLGLLDWLAKVESDQHHFLQAARLMVATGQPARALGYYANSLSDNNLAEATKTALAAGKPELALRWLSRYPATSAGYQQQYLTTAQMAGRPDLAAKAAHALSQVSDTPLKYQEIELRGYLESGNLTAAAELIDQLVSVQPENYRFRLQRWKISHWLSLPDKALIDAEWLLNRRFSQAIYQRTLTDAYALYQYPLVVRAIRLKARKQRISEQEFDLWMTSHQLEGTPEEALDDINRYSRRYGLGDRELFWQAQFFEETGQSQQQMALWQRFEQSSNREWRSLSGFARTFWLAGDYQQALSIVTQATAIPEDEIEEYWTLRGALAWQVGQRDEAKHAYGTLLEMGSRDAIVAQRHLETSFDSDQQRLNWLWAQHQENPAPERLNYLMLLAWNTQDSEKTKVLIDQLRQQNTPSIHLQGWRLMALHYQRQNNPGEALKIYDRLITDNGFDQQLAIDRGWLILFQGNPEKITHFYRQHQHHNAIPEWQPLLAAAAELIGNEREAIVLYLSLLGREPKNYGYSLSLAALLERQQLGDASARLHRYLSADLERIPDSEFIRKTTLVGRFFGPLAQSQQYADRLLQKGSLTKDETSQFYTSLLAIDQAALAHFYFGRRVWLERELPDWQQLQRAMRIGDRNEIAQLLIASDRLPPADSMTALTQIDKPHDALYLAQRSVLSGLSDTSEQQVINNWSGLRPAGFRAIQFELQPEDPLGAKRFGVTSFWSDNDWQWHARLSQLDFEDAGQQSFQSINLTNYRESFGYSSCSWFSFTFF